MQNEIRKGRRYECEKPWNRTLSMYFFPFHRINAPSESAPIKHLKEWSFFLNTRNDYLRRGNFVGVHKKKKSTHNNSNIIKVDHVWFFFFTFFNVSGTIYIIFQILVHSHVIGFFIPADNPPTSKEKSEKQVKPMMKMESRKNNKPNNRWC